jgi:hypothetical protein
VILKLYLAFFGFIINRLEKLTGTGIADRYQVDDGGYWCDRYLWKIIGTVRLLIE